MSFGGGGGGGGHVSLGPVIIRVNHFLKSTLNEDEATVPTALWTLHRTCAPGYRSQISYPFRGPVWEICEFDTLFAHFPVFDTLNAIRTLRAGWRKRYPFFTRFYWLRCCPGPNETCPSPPPPRMSLYSLHKKHKLCTWMPKNAIQIMLFKHVLKHY